MLRETTSKKPVTRRRTISGSEAVTRTVEPTRSTKTTVASLRSTSLKYASRGDPPGDPPLDRDRAEVLPRPPELAEPVLEHLVRAVDVGAEAADGGRPVLTGE